MKDKVENNGNVENGDAVPYTILVVDDDEALSNLNQKRLKKAGFHTERALNGNEAIDWIAENRDTLMLLDYKLPDMTGKQLVESLDKRQMQTPFIIVTGHGDERVAVEMMKLGAKDYLVKDTAFLDLLPTVVSRVVEQITLEKKLVECENEARKDLITKSKEMEDFIYIISHDLKEPLFAIEGYAKRLSRAYGDMYDEKGKSYLDRINANIETMAQRIYEIMQVIKIGMVKYDLTNNDINDIMVEMINMLEGKINNNKIKLIVQDKLPTLFCDRRRIKDVFTNLVTNAIKFMGDNDSREIKIGCDQKGEHFEFFVEDTGIGVGAEHHEQIFKIFSRLKNVETEGTGVGLAIVKKIVEVNKGKVWVESPIKDEKGSRFCFTIPVSVDKESSES